MFLYAVRKPVATSTGEVLRELSAAPVTLDPRLESRNRMEMQDIFQVRLVGGEYE